MTSSRKWAARLLFVLLSTSLLLSPATGMSGTPEKANTQEPLAVSLFPAELGRNLTLPVIRGTLSWGLFCCTGDPAELGDKVELMLDLPDGFAVYCKTDEVVQNLRKDNRQVVTLDVTRTARRIKPDKVVRDAIVFVWLETDAPTTDDETVSFYLETNGKQYSHKQMKLRILPPMKERPETEFTFSFMWNLFDGNVPEPVWDKAYELFRKSGINVFPTGACPYEKLGPYGQYMERRYGEDGGKLWATVPASYMYGIPPEWNERYMSKHAFTNFVDDGAVAFERIDRGCLASSKDRLDFYLWDLERYHAGIRPHSEDPATVKQFAQWSRRDVETLTPDFIEQNCAEEFETFREWQLGQTIRNFADWVHSYSPSIQILLCAGSKIPNPGHEDQRWWADANVIPQPMIYSDTAAYERILAKDIKLLPDKPFTATFWNSALVTNGLPAAYGPKDMRQRLIITAALGARGVMHWPGVWVSQDAEYMWHYGKAMNEVAKVEDFYRDGVKVDDIVDVKGLPEMTERVSVGKKELVIETPSWGQHLSTYAHKKGVETLVTVLNRHPEKDAFVNISMPQCARERYSVCDAITGELIIPREDSQNWWQSQFQKGVIVKVASEDIRFVIISPRKLAMKTEGRIVAAAVEAEYAATCQRAAESGQSAATLEKDGIRIGYDDRYDDGDVRITASTPAQQLWFDESGGRIVGWAVGKDKPAWIEPNKDSGFAMDKIWWPKTAWVGRDDKGQYMLVDRKIDSGVARIKWERILTNPVMGSCTLYKTFVVHADKPLIDVEIEISGRGLLSPVDFSYWSQSQLLTGDVAARFEYQGPDGVVSVSPKRLQNVFVKPAAELSDSEAVPTVVDAADKVPTTQGWMQLAAAGQGRVRVTTEYADLGQLYRWAGTGGHVTMEWMSRKVHLEVGQSWRTHYTLSYLRGE